MSEHLSMKQAFDRFGECALWDAYYKAEWERDSQWTCSSGRNVVTTDKYWGIIEGHKIEFCGLSQMTPSIGTIASGTWCKQDKREIQFQARMHIYDLAEAAEKEDK